MALKSQLGLLAIAATLSLALVGCSTTADAPQAEEKPKIGISFLNLQNQYWTDIIAGIEESAGDDYDVVVADPNDDAAKQVADLENFIADGVDAIVVAAIDAAAVEPVIAQAMAAGIKVVTHATKIAEYDTHITLGERDMGLAAGEMAGTWISENLDGEATYAVLNYPQIEQLIDRDLAIREGVANIAPNAEAVAEASAATAEEGLAAAEAILQAHPDLNVFVCINDNGCLGAIEAAKAVGKTPDTFAVVGIGGDPAALQSIVDGTGFVGTVDLNPVGTGTLLFDAIVELLAGGTVEKDQFGIVKSVYGADAAAELLAALGQ